MHTTLPSVAGAAEEASRDVICWSGLWVCHVGRQIQLAHSSRAFRDHEMGQVDIPTQSVDALAAEVEKYF